MGRSRSSNHVATLMRTLSLSGLLFFLTLSFLPRNDAFAFLTQGRLLHSKTYTTSYTDFQSSSSRRCRKQQQYQDIDWKSSSRTRLSMDFLESPFTEDIKTTARNVPGPEALMDSKGQEYSIGAVVRVVQEGLGAFQVPPKARGSFDAKTKQFVAAANENTDQKKSLTLPVGLRGVITKIYDPDAGISANYPVQVKFVPDENTEEGFSAPTSFLMHFMPHEIECV
jgi:hypothetical protein